jgi:hypothetical protein
MVYLGCPVNTPDHNLWCRYPPWMTSPVPAEVGLIMTSRWEMMDEDYLPAWGE